MVLNGTPAGMVQNIIVWVVYSLSGLHWRVLFINYFFLCAWVPNVVSWQSQIYLYFHVTDFHLGIHLPFKRPWNQFPLSWEAVSLRLCLKNTKRTQQINCNAYEFAILITNDSYWLSNYYILRWLLPTLMSVLCMKN